MDLRTARPVRVVALLTAAYSTAMTIKPAVLAKPCGMTTIDGSVPTRETNLIRSIGVRDVALALALAVSPTGTPMRVLTAARVASDGSDALWFGRIAPRSQVAKISGVAAAWATLEALVLLRAERSA